MKFSPPWKCLPALLLPLLLCAAPLCADEPEVDWREIARCGDMVQIIGDGIQDDGITQFVEAMSMPPNDAEKWFVYVIAQKNCPACEKLKTDWAADENLRAFADPASPKDSWAHFTVYDKDDKTQQFRWEALKLKGFPTVIVQPPRTGKWGDPGTVVLQHTGYDSDPKKLAHTISQQIRWYMSKVPKRERETQTRQAEADAKEPPRPRGQGIGQNSPFGGPDDVPFAPPVGPPPTPATTPPSPATDPENIGQEAIVVADDEDDPAVKRLLANLRTRPGLRIRLVTLREAIEKKLPVDRSEMPAVLFQEDGEIQDRVTRRTLPLLNREVGLTDLPWQSIIALFVGGPSVGAIVPLAVWLLLFIRSRRKSAGKTVLLPDDETAAETTQAAVEALAKQLVAVLNRDKTDAEKPGRK